MKVAILILNWCNYKSTSICLQSILDNSSILPGDIYLIDNASQDNSYELLKSSFTSINHIQTQSNLGYTGGNNFGMDYVFSIGYDLAIILNNDLVLKLSDSFLQTIDKQVEKKSGVLFSFSVHDLSTHREIFPKKAGLAIAYLFKLLGIVEDKVICGCALGISKNLYCSIGGFDETFFMYNEEHDYLIRTLLSGGHVMYVNSDYCHVYRDCSEVKRPSYVYYYQSRNLIKILDKYFLKKPKILLITFILVSIKQALFTFKYRNLSATLIGLYEGIRKNNGRKQSTFF